jgi:hypothetical protein
VKLRHRIAALGMMLALAVGIGASTQAGASTPAPRSAPVTAPRSTGPATNGCVVSPVLELAVCIPRL